MALDKCFEHWWLILEVILLTKMTGKAAILIIDRTYSRAFGMQFMNIKTTLFKNSLQPFWFATWESHFLWLTTMLLHRIFVPRIMVLLFSTIIFVHLEGFQCVR